MDQVDILDYVGTRINILKSEQVGLKLFIESDKNLYDALERAISELNLVLKQFEEGVS